MEELNKIVAENLVNLRTKCGYTQLQVAEKINYSDKSVSKWERGDAIPDIPVMLQLSKLYGVSLDDMVKKHEKEQIKPKEKNLLLSKQTLISIIAFVFVWLLATIGFAVVYGFYDLVNQAYLSFIVAIPISFLVVNIMSFFWYPYFVSAIFSSIFIWTAMLAVTQCVAGINMWLLYIIAIPLQLLVIFGFFLRKLTGKRQIKNV